MDADIRSSHDIIKNMSQLLLENKIKSSQNSSDRSKNKE